MKIKRFTQKQVEKKIKKVLTKFERKQLSGKMFPLKNILGDYQFNSRNRYIKEVLFRNAECHGRSGSYWDLRYPKEVSAKNLAKKVMIATYIS